MTGEREIILDSLIEILENGQYSHLIEKAVLDKYDYLKNNQKAFIKKVTEGTVENLIFIDKVIDSYAKTKVNKQKPLIRNLLRMSTYQILFLDKVPDSAVCNEAVKLAGKRGFRTLSGFVNGVLRAVSRDKSKIEIDNTSCPDWIKEHLTKYYGEDTAKLILEDFAKEHPVTIRARRELKNTENLIPSGILKNAYYVKKGVSLSQIEGYEEGDFAVQDISSQMVGQMAEIKPGDVVLDVCAAPGGKAICACDLGGIVEARDISESKVSIIDENIARCGCKNIKTTVWDATVPDERWSEKADVLILDAPCSGLGVIGKKADIKFKTNPEDLIELAQIQRKIIDTVWRYVKPGGRLMYSTCTLNPGENEEQARYIVDNYPFELINERTYIPGIDGTDGFYTAALIRK